MASPSPSSSVILEYEHHVFLSFRGEDTRNNFTGHLYAALCGNYISTFIDDDGLKKGDEISPMLLTAIEKSKISVVIFSENYASSTWCLDEVAKIMECRKNNGQIVVPVFLRVDPSDVRKQEGSFKDAFNGYERRFNDKPERVNRWRSALTEAAGLSGYHLTKERSESSLIEEIVEDSWKKLIEISSLSENCEALVGINSRIIKIELLLKKSKVVGIWGMGGIGKTTIAKTLFKGIHKWFDGSCFIENVREALENGDGGLIPLQQKIISKLMKNKTSVIDTPNTMPEIIKVELQHKKVLIVLDDVNNCQQLDLLIGWLEPLRVESRIIVTTRNKQVLSCYGENNIYEVELLNNDESLLLFCKCAFKENYPPGHLESLSHKILSYAKGNPLAIEILGFNLRGMSKEAWESVMNDLKMVCKPKIHDVLRISYNGLKDPEKKIFLDIACFLKGHDKNDVLQVLQACYETTKYSFEVLIKKALIKISYNKLEMHDLLQEVGLEIFKQESKKTSGICSRLWHEDDVRHVLQHNVGVDVVEVIFLDTSRLKKVIEVNSEAFMKMVNLRVLKLYWSKWSLRDYENKYSKIRLPQGLKNLPNELRYLHWDGYPLKELPSEFSPKKLLVLKLPYSKIKKFCLRTKDVVNLELIDVSCSKLCEFPNLQNSLKPKIIGFQGCKSLPRRPLSTMKFTNLRRLDMKGCHYLKSIPGNIEFKSPITVDFSHCTNLVTFPQISGKVRRLKLCQIAVEEVPPSIGKLTELRNLNLSNCVKLQSISTELSQLKSLKSLDLSDCLTLESIPDFTEKMNLNFLDCTRTAIKELPSLIENLTRLVQLNLCNCERLQSLPTGLSQLISLESLDLTCCSKLESIPDFSEKMKLNFLHCRGTAIKELPSSIAHLTRLRYLEVKECKNLVTMPISIWDAYHSLTLSAEGSSISRLPFSNVGWECIDTLNLAYCNLTEFPEVICQLFGLLSLELMGNDFGSVPTSIKQLRRLQYFCLNGCSKIHSIQGLPMPVQNFFAMNCKQLQTLPDPAPDLVQLDEYGFPTSSTIFLDFTNCQNLNQEAYSNFLSQIQHMTTAYHKVYNKIPNYEVFLPGREIPEWFNIQSPGSSITFELPQHCSNRRLIGFVICAVITYEKDAHLSRTDSCHSFGSDNRIFVDFFFQEEADSFCMESDHMEIDFIPAQCLRLVEVEGHSTEVTFDFRTVIPEEGNYSEYASDASDEPDSDTGHEDLDIPKLCEVKCCGVNPIYEDPQFDFPTDITPGELDFEPDSDTSDEPDSDTRNEFDSDTSNEFDSDTSDELDIDT